MIQNQPYKSPDGQNKIELFYLGGIKFGPDYFSFALNGIELQERIIGKSYKWDPKSKYLALQEWLTIDYQVGPITALLVIDLIDNKIARLSIAEKGFIEPLRFEESSIIYNKEYFNFGGNKSIEYEIDLNEVKNWDKIK